MFVGQDVHVNKEINSEICCTTAIQNMKYCTTLKQQGANILWQGHSYCACSCANWTTYLVSTYK